MKQHLEIIARALSVLWLLIRVQKSDAWIFPAFVMVDEGAPAYAVKVTVEVLNDTPPVVRWDVAEKQFGKVLESAG